MLLFANSLVGSVFITISHPVGWPTDTFSYLPWQLDYYFQSAGAALLIMWVYVNQSSRVVAILELSLLNYIGIISYGVYMWQGFFLSTGPDRAAGQIWPPAPLIGLAGLCVVAPLSFHFFEKPFLDLKSRLGPKWTAAGEEQA
jgi:peptidoglycan/LPS O-acetylase OafA/YrhL